MSKRKIYHTFDLVQAEESAKSLCKELWQRYTPSMKHLCEKPYYTPWTLLNGAKVFAVWYYYHIDHLDQSNI